MQMRVDQAAQQGQAFGLSGVGELVSNCLVRLSDDVGALVCNAIGFHVFGNVV